MTVAGGADDDGNDVGGEDATAVGILLNIIHQSHCTNNGPASMRSMS